MIYVINKSVDPSFNHALEEYFLKDTREPVFMIWQNEPTVLIGRNQNLELEINTDFTKAHDMHVVRRLSGGGTVYCDLNNCQYTFITNRDDKDENLFKSFARPVVLALKKLGLDADFTGRNDIMIGDKKVSGNAQYRYKDRIIHHGTLLFDADMELLSGSMKAREIKFIDKNVHSHRAHVGLIKNYVDMDVHEFIDYIAKNIVEYHNISEIREPSNDELEGLKKYLSDFPDFNKTGYDKEHSRKYMAKKYPFGLVEYGLDDEDGKIKKLKIMGDFFLNNELEPFLSSIRGINIESIEDELKFDIGDFIIGMTNDEFISDLKHLYRGE